MVFTCLFLLLNVLILQVLLNIFQHLLILIFKPRPISLLSSPPNPPQPPTKSKTPLLTYSSLNNLFPGCIKKPSISSQILSILSTSIRSLFFNNCSSKYSCSSICCILICVPFINLCCFILFFFGRLLRLWSSLLYALILVPNLV